MFRIKAVLLCRRRMLLVFGLLPALHALLQELRARSAERQPSAPLPATCPLRQPFDGLVLVLLSRAFRRPGPQPSCAAPARLWFGFDPIAKPRKKSLSVRPPVAFREGVVAVHKAGLLLLRLHLRSRCPVLASAEPELQTPLRQTCSTAGCPARRPQKRLQEAVDAGRSGSCLISNIVASLSAALQRAEMNCERSALAGRLKLYRERTALERSGPFAQVGVIILRRLRDSVPAISARNQSRYRTVLRTGLPRWRGRECPASPRQFPAKIKHGWSLILGALVHWQEPVRFLDNRLRV